MTERLSSKQADYLRYLRAEGPVVIDETRCTMKLPALSTVMPDAVLVHLYRHPVAFVSSHLIASQDRKRWRQALLRLAFFRRPFAFNNWGMGELWRAPILDNTRAFLGSEAVQIPRPTDPALHKLMAFWLAAFRRIEREGRVLYGARFVSLPFEAFCADPQQHLSWLRTRAGAPDFTYDLSALTAASPGHRPQDARWAAAARAVGFDAAEMDRFFPEARQ